MSKSYRVSARVGSAEGGVGDSITEIGKFSKKGEAESAAKAFMGSNPPVSEFDSVQIVPYVNGQRDWTQQSKRWIASVGKNRSRWVPGKGN